MLSAAMSIQLTQEQQLIVKQIQEWLLSSRRKPFITLGGYAGTGKTTLIPIILNALNEDRKEPMKVALCSYTGRAALNLKTKLPPEVANSSRNKVSTIHGLIYTPIEDSRGSIAGWKLKETIDADLIIVDEGSMVSGDIWQDLLSFMVPILVVGDHGQLPPIKGSFNLMEKPDLILNEIHRQAKDNPIIKVSIMDRETGLIPAREYGDSVIKFDVAESDTHMVREDMLSNYTTDTLIICGYNKTRTMINQYIRSTLDFESPEPQVGDRVICLRNNHEKGIYNGMLGTVEFIKSASEDWYEAEIKMDDVGELYFGKLYKPQFNAPEAINFTKDRLKATGGDLFDFGYALTVHKAQGSQAKKVILFEERFSKMDDIEWRKWLYTAVTRAEEELYIFGR